MDDKIIKADAVPIIYPNPGRQTQALANPADILIYGGSAGGGKSWFLFLEALRSIHIPGYVASYFRRTYADIMVDGGAWQKSRAIFEAFGGTANNSSLTYKFPSTALVGFSNLEHEWSVGKYQSAEIAKLLFDELCQFLKFQFWYMQSRNRTTCGVRPITRGACNPDPDSWVKELILPWLDEEAQFPNLDMAGQILWMVHESQSDSYVWYNKSPEDFLEILHNNKKEDPDYEPISVSFLPASVDDNPHMLKAGYKSKLLNLPLIERQRLLYGDWKIRPAAGTLFRREWFQKAPRSIPGLRLMRYWDRAATKKQERKKNKTNDPDWTVGTLMGVKDGVYWILDIKRIRGTPNEVESLIVSTADQDRNIYGRVEVGIEQDPGSAGKFEASYYAKALSGHIIRLYTVSSSKIKRAEPFSAQCQAGNVIYVDGDWNNVFLAELEAFPEGPHDDIVDSCSGCFTALHNNKKRIGTNW